MNNQRKKELLAQAKANTDQGNLETVYAAWKAEDPEFPEDCEFLDFQGKILDLVARDKEEAEEELLEKIERHTAEGRKFWREVYLAHLGKHGGLELARIAANHALEDFEQGFPIQS